MTVAKPRVEYCFPKTVEEACEIMQEYGDLARLIAGGTDLWLLMEQEQDRPKVMIDLTRIPLLQELRVHEGCFEIGSAVTYSQLLATPAIC